MWKYLVLGIIFGIAVVFCAVVFTWKVILIPIVIFLVLAPFSTSGKGFRNYFE